MSSDKNPLIIEVTTVLLQAPKGSDFGRSQVFIVKARRFLHLTPARQLDDGWAGILMEHARLQIWCQRHQVVRLSRCARRREANATSADAKSAIIINPVLA